MNLQFYIYVSKYKNVSKKKMLKLPFCSQLTDFLK